MPKNKVSVPVLFFSWKCIYLEFDAFAYLSIVTHTLILWFILLYLECHLQSLRLHSNRKEFLLELVRGMTV